MQNNHWTKWRKRNKYSKEKLKVRFFLFCEVINTWGRIKVVQLNISENSLCYPFMQPTTFTDNNVCFMFSGKRKQQSKPSTTTTSTFSGLDILDKMTTNLSFNTKDQQRKIIIVKLQSIGWSSCCLLVEMVSCKMCFSRQMLLLYQQLILIPGIENWIWKRNVVVFL